MFQLDTLVEYIPLIIYMYCTHIQTFLGCILLITSKFYAFSWFLHTCRSIITSFGIPSIQKKRMAPHGPKTWGITSLEPPTDPNQSCKSSCPHIPALDLEWNQKTQRKAEKKNDQLENLQSISLEQKPLWPMKNWMLRRNAQAESQVSSCQNG